MATDVHKTWCVHGGMNYLIYVNVSKLNTTHSEGSSCHEP
jgi:hypothetical protein